MGSAPIVGGDVLFDGRSLVGRRPEDVARRGIALVPEGRRIFGELTVEENLRLGLAGRRQAQERRRAGASLRALSGPARVPLAARRRAVGRPAAAAGDRACARRRSRCPAARRALARAGAEDRRRRLRGAGADQGSRPRSPPRRAAGPANRRPRRPLLRARQRRASPHPRPGGRGRHRPARCRLPRMTLAFLNLSWPIVRGCAGARRASTRSWQWASASSSACSASSTSPTAS